MKKLKKGRARRARMKWMKRGLLKSFEHRIYIATTAVYKNIEDEMMRLTDEMMRLTK